jgi:hypothetical protein
MTVHRGMAGVHREMAGGHRPDQGFMLIEAAVAMAVILVVMGAITSYFLASTRVVREQQDAELAAQIATSGMTTVHSIRGPALIAGRDLTSSNAQWNTLPSAAAPYLAGSAEAWDPAATAGSGATAALPTTPLDTIVRGLTYHMSWYIGSCWQPAAGGACDQTISAGAVAMYRVVVTVIWADVACANGLCTYADAALVSSAPIDPIFNTGGTPTTSGIPFSGTATAVPGTVQAEDYDDGGQGVGYSVSSVNGGGYRNESADIESTNDTSGNYDIGWTAAGQWQHYTLNVVYAGTYTIGIRVAAPSAVTDAFHLANSSGTSLGGNVNLPATTNWQTWTTVTVTLTAGQQTLTLAQDHGGWNINYLVFAVNEGPFSGTPAAIPGVLQIEDYDTGGQGLGYSVGSVNGAGYRVDSADLESTSDVSGNADMGWTSAGQWQRYTVNVAAAGTYSVAIRYAAPGAVTDAFHLATSSGTTLGVNNNLATTGGWQNWVTTTTTVTLPAGQQILTLAQDHGGWNINYLTFTSLSGVTTPVGATWYTVINQNSNSCVEAANSATTDGTAVQQSSCTGSTNQGWQFTAVGSYYKVLNRNAAAQTQVWDVTGGAPAVTAGTKIQTSTYAGGFDQQWQSTLLGSGWF